VIAQPRGRLVGRRAAQRRRAAPGQAARLLQLVAASERAERRLDQGRGDAARA
jgi:hypothetical protein